jgi:hypothetical protein
VVCDGTFLLRNKNNAISLNTGTAIAGAIESVGNQSSETISEKSFVSQD